MGVISPKRSRAGQPKRLLVLDTETLPRSVRGMSTVKSHTLRLAVASKWVWIGDKTDRSKGSREIERLGPYSLLERKLFRDADSIGDWLVANCPRRFTTWLVCHNAAFDCRVAGIFELVSKGRLTWDLEEKPTPILDGSDRWAEPWLGCIVLADPPTILSLRVPGGGRLVIVDSLNWFPMPLSKLGKAVGREKLPMPAWEAPEREWVDYCQRDVEITERAVISLISWLHAREFGELRYTVAGQAYGIFRSNYLKRTLESSNSLERRKFEREAYYGGEVLIFRMGEIRESIHQVDVRSIYPFIMSRLPVPVATLRAFELKRWRPGPPPGNLINCMARVRFCSGSSIAPQRKDGATRYCAGSFDTVLCGPELAHHAAHGRIEAHETWVEYETEPILSEFVRDFWQIRREAILDGDHATDLFSKLLLNSLYGKFGQQSGDLQPRTDFYAPVEFGRWFSVDVSTKKVRRFLVAAHQAFEEIGRLEIENSFPAISAWITSGARVFMSYLRRAVGRANLIYQAVDSLITTNRGLTRLQKLNLVDSLELGKLKLEHSAPMGIIRGWGDYQIGDQRKLVGVKAGAEQLDDGSHAYSTFSGLRELLFSGPGRSVTESRRVVRLPEPQSMGRTDRLGNVRPLTVWEPKPKSLYVGSDEERIGFNIRGDQVKDPCEVLFSFLDCQFDSLDDCLATGSSSQSVRIGSILQE